MNVEVLFSPFFIAPLTETVIMLPPFRDLFPPLDLNKVCEAFHIYDVSHRLGSLYVC